MISDFYKSKEWKDFVELMRLKKTDADGFIKCEHCGKPIVKKYDCIAHHLIFLTEENYNDLNISLNPNNIMLLHHRCHNIVHDKLGIYGNKVYIVHGSPLSGKTTFVKSSMSVGDLIVDMDRIWHCFTGCDMYIKPGRLRSEMFRVRDLLIEDVKNRLGNWKNAYIIGGYPMRAERERLAAELGAELVHIDTSREECMERLESCDDRDVDEWRKYVEDYWDLFS